MARACVIRVSEESAKVAIFDVARVARLAGEVAAKGATPSSGRQMLPARPRFTGG